MFIKVNMIRKLTKKEYLGEGYVHKFIHKNGEVKYVPCTKEEYDALALPNPINPTLKNYTWVCSGGGTIKVDNPDTMLGDDEYCELPDGRVLATLSGVEVNNKDQFFDKVDIDKDGNIDDVKIKNKI